jgi:hypothetical protein
VLTGTALQAYAYQAPQVDPDGDSLHVLVIGGAAA